MKLPVPQNALALAIGGLALVIATTGTAVAATGTSMNITDPVNAGNKAKVDAGGRLLVGDGAGALDVTGLVGTRPSTPSAFTAFASLFSTSECQIVYTPPTGKGAVVTGLSATQFRALDAEATFLHVYVGTGFCENRFVATFALDNEGTVTRTFPAGLNVPAGQQLTAAQFGYGGADYWYLNADGYTAPASSVPASPTTGATARMPPPPR